MKVNRYTQISPSRFNPLSMREIFTVPLARQRKHDEMQAKLDELGLFDINRLSEDDETARKYIEGYQSRVNEEVDRIMNQGVNNQTLRNVRSLISDKNKWMSPDQEGGRIQANFNAFQDYKKGLDTAYEKGDLELSRYNALLNNARKDYVGGVAADGNLNLMKAATKVNIAEKLRPYANDLRQNPTVIEQYSGMRSLGNGLFLDEKTRREYHQEDLIKNILNNIAMSDPEIQSFLSQQKQLGLIDSPTDYINKLSGTFDAGYSQRKLELDRIYRGSTEKGSKKDSIPNTYETASDETVTSYKSDLFKRLSRLGTNKPVTAEVDRISGTALGPVPTKYKTTETGKYTLDDLSPSDKAEYDRVFEGLRSSAMIDSSLDKNSPEAYAAVNKYIQDHQTVTYSPLKMTTGLIKTFDSQGAKFKKTTSKDMAHAIYLNPEDRHYYDPDKNKYMSYDELDSDVKEQIENQKFDVSGVYSANNYFAQTLPSTVRKDQGLFVSPYEIKLPGENKKLLVTRSSSERNTKAFKAQTKYNELWSNTAMYPDIPYKTTLKGEPIQITRIQDTGQFIINTLDKDGNVTSVLEPVRTEAQLEKILSLWMN